MSIENFHPKTRAQGRLGPEKPAIAGGMGWIQPNTERQVAKLNSKVQSCKKCHRPHRALDWSQKCAAETTERLFLDSSNGLMAWGIGNCIWMYDFYLLYIIDIIDISYRYIYICIDDYLNIYVYVNTYTAIMYKPYKKTKSWYIYIYILFSIT